MSEYFSKDHFNLLSTWKTRRYDGTDPEQRGAYNALKEAYGLTSDWAHAVQQQLFPDGYVEVRRRPTTQANTFSEYHWAKIYPQPNAPTGLAYTVGIDTQHGFVVKIDTVGLGDADPVRRKYETLRGPYSNQSPIVAMLAIDEGLGLTMAALAQWTVDAIKGFGMSYDDVAARLDLVPAQNNVLRHFEPYSEYSDHQPHWSPETMDLFVRLAAAIHGCGLDWYFTKATNSQLRFGRKHKGERRGNPLGALYLHRRGIRINCGAVGDFPGCDRADLTPEIVAALESARFGRQLPPQYTPMPERQGYWPDDYAVESDEAAAAPGGQSRRSAQPRNVIYYGPPGTGKTYALQQLLQQGYTDPGTGAQRYAFVTFHQSYGYEEFVEGLRPVLDSASGLGQVRYEIRPGAFKQLCREARRFPDQRFAMVIDEINRGNISKIFGELITLIEPDKRDPLNGASPTVEVTLAYSGEPFSVPANVDIIGTMNTADRSLALMDTALRRRFDFVAQMPDTRDDPDAPLHGLVVTLDTHVIDVRSLLHSLNERIEALYDRDHAIGHAYFTPLRQVDDGPARFEALGQIFRNRIVPLLEEYFFEDWQKIRLVLADHRKPKAAAFVLVSDNHEGDLSHLFGRDHGLDGLATRKRYTLQGAAFTNPDAYMGVYEPGARMQNGDSP